MNASAPNPSTTNPAPPSAFSTDVQETWHSAWEKFVWSLRLSWTTSPGLLSMLLLLTVFRGMLPAAVAVAGRNLINGAATALQQPGSGYDQVYLWLGIGLLAAILMSVSGTYQIYIRNRFQDEVDYRMSYDLLSHAAQLEVADFEDPEFQNLFQKAQQNPAGNGAFFITLLLSIAMGIIQIVSLFAILVVLEPLIIPLLLLTTVPYFIFRLRFARSRSEEDLARTQKVRWTAYYSSRLISPNNVPETRLFDLSPLFLRQFKQIRSEFRSRNRHFQRLNLLGTALFNLASVVVVYIAFTRATLKVISANLTVGDIAVFAAAATQLRSSIETTVDLLGAVRQQLIFTGIIMQFLALRPHRLPSERPLAQPLRGAIDMEDVSFTYPGTQDPVLHNLNLHIQPGEVVALVGHNGSGKTTLAKLIARLYDADSGKVRIDGIDLRDIDPQSLQRQIAFVFQNFGQYEASAAENIAYGRWDALLENPDAVREVAERTGVAELIEKMASGYDTRLGRMFGQTNLSGGQWQQIALARTLARDAAILILDEPTASLDMQSEHRLYAHYRRLAEGRTTILISHRFSTVRMADRVVVMEDGRIVEHGSHDELVALGGRYATLFQLYREQMIHGAKET